VVLDYEQGVEVLFGLDQVLHVGLLVLVFLLPLKKVFNRRSEVRGLVFLGVNIGKTRILLESLGPFCSLDTFLLKFENEEACTETAYYSCTFPL
jgi:hypothetical protein